MIIKLCRMDANGNTFCDHCHGFGREPYQIASAELFELPPDQQCFACWRRLPDWPSRESGNGPGYIGGLTDAVIAAFTQSVAPKPSEDTP